MMDSTEASTTDGCSSETKSNASTLDDKSLSVSTQCKSCKKDFTQSTILKHITHKPSCKIDYSEREIQLYQQWSKEEHNNKRLGKLKKSYDPVKRRERHLKEQKKKNLLKAKSDETNFVNVTTRCKSCKIVFPEASIFRHISQNKECRGFYSDAEIKSFSDWTCQRRNETQRKLYDRAKRRQKYLNNKAVIAQIYQENKSEIAKTYQENKSNIAKRYHDNIGKYIEKPSDRKTIKGQSFVKVFEKAFDDACHEFFVDLCLKIEGIVTENNNHKSSNDENPGSEILEEKIIQITKAMALKLWRHPFPRFQNIDTEKQKFYKDAFAIFYHGTPFLEAYNKTFDSCLDEVMRSHHIFCNEINCVDVAIRGSVEKHCEHIFETNFFEAIMEASEEYVIKYMIEFLTEEFEKRFPLTPQHQSRVRTWLKKEIQEPT